MPKYADLNEAIQYCATPEERKMLKTEYRVAYMWGIPDEYKDLAEAEIIFLLAVGKSGTTTTTHMLNLSESVMAYHEAPPRLWDMDQQAFQYNGMGRELDSMYRSIRRDIVNAVNGHGYIYAECNHRLLFFAKAVERICPKARFIYQKRNLDDTVRSGYNWGWYSKHDTYGGGRIVPPADHTVREAIAWAWANSHNFALDFLDTIDRDRWFYIDFEDYASQNVEKMYDLFRWVGGNIPTEAEILYTLGAKHNKSSVMTPQEKNWHQYDDAATEIDRRIANVC